MKMRRGLFAPVIVSLFVAIGALGWWGGASPARAEPGWSTAKVPVTGTVSGGSESVDFSGEAQVGSALSLDKATGDATLVLEIDLSAVTATGSATQEKYVVSGRQFVQRQLSASDLIEVTFPFFSGDGKDISTARSAVASFAFSFDLTTGAVTSARATVFNPNYSN